MYVPDRCIQALGLTIWQVAAQKHFEWHSCYGGKFQCARLQVPMDWTNTSEEARAGKTVELAVIKVEATVPVTDPSYGGSIVLNPGQFADV